MSPEFRRPICAASTVSATPVSSWKAKFGKMEVSEAKRLRALVAEKRSYGADQTKICRRRTVGSQDIGRKKRLEANTTYVPNSRPASAIVEAAKKLGCNLIVMASHGRRGIKKVLLGSQTSEVVVTATVPVLSFTSLTLPEMPRLS